MGPPLKILPGQGKYRVVILARDDGHFTADVEYWYETYHEGELVAKGWAPLRFAGGAIYATAEIAEKEAAAGFRAYLLEPFTPDHQPPG